jgi:hypothetical protein
MTFFRNSFSRRAGVFLILVSLLSCSRSEFSSTHRVYRNGHYVNVKKPSREHISGYGRSTPKSPAAPKAVTGSNTPGEEHITYMASASGEILVLAPPAQVISPVEDLTPAVSAGQRPSVHPDTVIIIREKKASGSTPGNIVTNIQPGGKRVDQLALWSFITSLTGFLLFGAIILGPLAVILGGLSLRKFAKEPFKFKGKGLAIAGIIIGAVSFFAMLVLLLI